MLESLPIPAFRAQSIATFNHGVRAMRDGDVATATQAWRDASVADTNLTPAAYNLAIALEDAGDHHGAADAWGRVLSADPFDTRALIRQATAFRQIDQVADAIKNYESAIRIYPYYRFWYADFAEVLEKSGRNGEATMLRARGEALDTDAIEMAFEDGVRNLRRANWSLAQACFEAILEDWPEAVEAWIRLAQALAGELRYNEAINALNTALQHADTTPARVHYQRGRIFLLAGSVDAALSDLELAVRFEPAFGLAQELLHRTRAATALTSAAAETAAGSAGPLDQRTAGLGPPPGTDSSTSVVHPSDHPILPAPDPGMPWEDRVRVLIRQASLIPGPTGKPPRIALILERNAALAMAANHVISVLNGPEFPKLPDGAQPVYVVEAESRTGEGSDGVVAGGWLGSKRYPAVDVLRWPQVSEPLPIDELLAALLRDAPGEAFNLVLIVASGRVRSTQNATVRLARQFPAFQFAMVSPAGAGNDLSLRFQGIAPNWVEISY